MRDWIQYLPGSQALSCCCWIRSSLTVSCKHQMERVCARLVCVCVCVEWAVIYKSTVALYPYHHAPPPPAAATVSATIVQSQMSYLILLPPVLAFFNVVVVVVVARQFRFKRSFQSEINYRKYPDQCIICTPDFHSNFMVKKVRINSMFTGNS